jgi:hypothetical protein
LPSCAQLPDEAELAAARAAAEAHRAALAAKRGAALSPSSASLGGGGGSDGRLAGNGSGTAPSQAQSQVGRSAAAGNGQGGGGVPAVAVELAGGYPLLPAGAATGGVASTGASTHEPVQYMRLGTGGVKRGLGAMALQTEIDIASSLPFTPITLVFKDVR